MTMGFVVLGLSPGNRVVSGQTVNVSCTFTVSGNRTDPTTVVASYRLGTASAVSYTYPSAASADSALVRDGSGVYHFDFIAINSGIYYVRIAGSSACQAAAELALDSVASHF